MVDPEPVGNSGVVNHTGREDDLFLWALLLLGVDGYLTEAVRVSGQNSPAFETVSFVGYFFAAIGASTGATPETAVAAYTVVWWSHSLLALWLVTWVSFAKPLHVLSLFANLVTHDKKAVAHLPGVPVNPQADTELEDVDDFIWNSLTKSPARRAVGVPRSVRRTRPCDRWSPVISS